jgi:hypothetical protein
MSCEGTCDYILFRELKTPERECPVLVTETFGCGCERIISTKSERGIIWVN